jgi:hypothetical protein
MFFKLCWRAPCTEIRSSIVLIRERRRTISYCDAVEFLAQLLYKGTKCSSARIAKENCAAFTGHSPKRSSTRRCSSAGNVMRVRPSHGGMRYTKGDYPRCPRCGTFRLTRLATRDKIDPMQKGFVNFALKLVGSELYHCRYCRLQFYDTRKPIAPEGGEKADAVAPIATAVQGSEGCIGFAALRVLEPQYFDTPIFCLVNTLIFWLRLAISLSCCAFLCFFGRRWAPEWRKNSVVNDPAGCSGRTPRWGVREPLFQ